MRPRYLALLPGLLLVACATPADPPAPAASASSTQTPPEPEASAETNAEPTAPPTASIAVEPPPPPKKKCVPPDMGGPRQKGFRVAGTTIVGGAISEDACKLVVWSNLGELLFFDVEQSKLLARLRPGTQPVPAGFIDDQRIAYCGDDEHLSTWDGRSPPVHIATLEPKSPAFACRALMVDPKSKLIAVLAHSAVPTGYGDYTNYGYGYDYYSSFGAREGTVTVFDYEGHAVAKRPKVGVVAPAFAGGWYTAADYNAGLQSRRFYDMHDVSVAPVETWPEGAVFPLLGRGPETFETYSAIGLHSTTPGGKAPEIPRKHGMSMAGAFSPDQAFAVIAYRPDRAGADGGIAFFDPAFKGELGYTPKVSATGFALTPDGAIVVAFDGLNARFLEAPTGKVLGVITAGMPSPDYGYGYGYGL